MLLLFAELVESHFYVPFFIKHRPTSLVTSFQTRLFFKWLEIWDNIYCKVGTCVFRVVFVLPWFKHVGSKCKCKKINFFSYLVLDLMFAFLFASG